MKSLPINEVLTDIHQGLHEQGSVVLQAPTGAGKTTRVPLSLLDKAPEGTGQIVVVEPRRLAARLAAHHVAQLRGEPVGHSVGYTVRFDRKCGPNTRIRYSTAGVVVRELARDPTLAPVSVLVFDEFHERHLEDDLLVAWAQRLKTTSRPDLQIIVMSATLNPEPLAQALNAVIVRSQGRSFPVAIDHATSRDKSPLHVQVAGTLRQALEADDTGDVLIFLPGLATIRRCQNACRQILKDTNTHGVMLHGSQSPEESRAALRPAPKGQRKVLFATNIAESSVTLDGVTTVIDTGLHKVAESSPWTGLTQLTEAPIPQDSAIQRAGRAGRTSPGRCVRLFTEADFQRRPGALSPEVHRVDLTATVLLLATFDVGHANTLPWLEVPQTERWSAAQRLLLDLGALDDAGVITPLGNELARLPLHPRLARLVWATHEAGLPKLGACAAALLDADIRPADTTDDHLCDVQALMDGPALSGALRKRVQQSQSQIVRMLPSAVDVQGADPDETLRKAFLGAFPDRLARRLGTRHDEWAMVGGITARLSPQSGVRNATFAVALRASGGDRPFIQLASTVEPDWILELPNAEADLEEGVEVHWDKKAERVQAERVVRWRKVPLERKSVPARGVPEATALLVRQVQSAGLGRFLDVKRLNEYRNRRRVAHEADSTVPLLDAEVIEAQLVALCEGCASLKDVANQDLMSLLENTLDWKQQKRLNALTPHRVPLASGRSAAVLYVDEGPPRVRAKIQHFLGMQDGPRLGQGRIPVLLELLAPNQRPAQVTDDLRGFWERTWPQVRKELRGRYPKHKWPEDPTKDTS
jgi:ATP-dependent helicase HrpB